MLLFAFVLLAFASSTNAIFKGDEALKYFEETAMALQKALQFMDREIENVNGDAFIGTRFVDGQLAVLLKHLSRKGWIFRKPNGFHKVQKLQKIAQDVSDRGIPIMKRKDPEGFWGMEPFISKGFWNMDYKTRWVDPDLMTTTLYPHREAMDEGNSDYCISEFFGRQVYNKTEKTCNISHSCWILMTSPQYSQYSLTHEIFYLEIGQRFGCFPEMQKMVTFYQQKSIDKLLAIFCSNIYQEAQMISWHKYYWTKQDLFMEQAALCGVLGYRDFFKPNWLKSIISWQSDSGCYKSKIPKGFPKNVWKKLEWKSKRRQKRDEKELSNGCLAHKTTVAASALAMYLRYISEDIDSKSVKKDD